MIMKGTIMYRKRAFTLIELLVVISIIALLVSILMPALGRARDLAKKTVCLTQERSLFLGLTLYTSDFNDFLPLASDAISITEVPLGGWWYASPSNLNLPISWNGLGPVRFWQQTSASYLGEQWEIFKCPASKCVGPHDTGNKEASYAGHYGCSVTVMAKGRRDITVPHKKIDNFKVASSKAAIFDSGVNAITHFNAQNPTGFFHYIPGYWNNKNGENGSWPFESEWGTQGYAKDIFEGRHPNREINITWLDGHGSSMNVDDFVDEDAHWIK